MNQKIEIWNCLTEGEITVQERNGEQLTLFVNIPWIRSRLKPLGDSFVLTLTGVKKVDFLNFDGTSSSLSDELDGGTPVILSTESESMPISINTMEGTLVLDYQDINFTLDTGQPISYEEIEKVCFD